MTKYYKTKETAIKHLTAGKCFSNIAFELFRNDKDVALTALRHSRLCEVVPKQFSGKPDFAEALLCSNQYRFINYLDMQSIGSSLLDDQDFIFLMMMKMPLQRNVPNLYLASSYNCKWDFDICKRLVERDTVSICLLPEILKFDTEILKTFAEKSGGYLYREKSFRRLIEELGLPDVDAHEMVKFVDTLEFTQRLEYKFPEKTQSKTVKL